MHRRLFIFGIAALSALGSLSMQVGTAGALESGEYFIGMLTDETGPHAAVGTPFNRASRLAVKMINDSGYLGTGVTITLVEREVATDPARGIQAANQLVADSRVIGSTCCMYSPLAEAVTKVVDGKLSLVIQGATRSKLPKKPWVYSTAILPGPNDITAAVHVAEALGAKTAVYFVAGDNDALKERSAGARKALEAKGVKTLEVISTLGSDTDFNAPVAQAMANAPDLILIHAQEVVTVGAINALRSRGWTKTIVGTDGLSPQPIYQKLGDKLHNVAFPVAFQRSAIKSPEGLAFRDAYEAAFSVPVDYYAAEGYTAMWTIAQALKSIDGKADRQSLMEALGKVTTIEHNVYENALAVDETGQAKTAGSAVLTWTAEGKVEAWKP
jgi:ABC-type branched-subunit amino acid transport system substrate-binding protein